MLFTICSSFEYTDSVDRSVCGTRVGDEKLIREVDMSECVGNLLAG